MNYRQLIKELYNLTEIKFPDEDFRKIFNYIDVAEKQRDLPETVMLEAQRRYGAGLGASILEHAGDLIQRPFDLFNWNSAGFQYCKEKINFITRYSHNRDNLKARLEYELVENSKNKNLKLDDYKNKLNESLIKYANAHSNLPEYNDCMKTMKNLCYSFGTILETDYNSLDSFFNSLGKLENKIKIEDEWIEYAHNGINLNITSEDISQYLKK